MLGAVVLEQKPRPWRFETYENLLLLIRPGMVIAVAKGKSAKRGSMKGIIENLFGFLS